MPAAEPTIAMGYAEALLNFAASRGANRIALLATAGIAGADLRDRDARLPLPRFFRLLEAAKASSGDPALALRFGSEADLAEVSVVGLIGRSAESVTEAVALLNRYGRLILDVDYEGAERFQLVEDEDGQWVVDTRKNPAEWPELNECMLARLASVGRQLFPDVDYVEALHFAHPAPAYADRYEQILGAAVAFGDEFNRMRFDPAALRRRIAVQQPRYAFEILAAHAEALLERLGDGATVRSQVEEVLTAALPQGRCGLEQVAQRLGLSRRTLHRRLQAEGPTFEQVLDELRRKLAGEQLAAGASVKRTAHLLGFSDASALSRAFKRWTGSSPTAGRRSIG